MLRDTLCLAGMYLPMANLLLCDYSLCMPCHCLSGTAPLRHMSGCWQAALVACSAAVQSPVTGPNNANITPVGAPVTVNFSSFQLGSNALPETDPALARTRNATEPDQIHISIGGTVGQLLVHQRWTCARLAVALSTSQCEIHLDLRSPLCGAGNVSEMYVTWVTADAMFYANGPSAPPTMQTVVGHCVQ